VLDCLGDGILVHEIFKQFHEEFTTADFESVLEVRVVHQFGDVLVSLARTCDPFISVTHAPVELGDVVLKVFMRVSDMKQSACTLVRATCRALEGRL